MGAGTFELQNEARRVLQHHHLWRQGMQVKVEREGPEISSVPPSECAVLNLKVLWPELSALQQHEESKVRSLAGQARGLLSELVWALEDVGLDSAERVIEKARQEREERDAFEAEKARWTAMHGSEHLKMALARGYNSSRIYAEERLRLEHPEWKLSEPGRKDKDGIPIPGSRVRASNPSHLALKMDAEAEATFGKWTCIMYDSGLNLEFIEVKWLGRFRIERLVAEKMERKGKKK